jgi:hypothetical protein
MSTVRIQVRRGTASQWQSINPILAAGEMGLESDTNFIKFGDGTQHWNSLGYANEPLSNLENTLADYVLLEDVGQPNGVASLNSSGKVPSDQIALSGPITMTGAFTADTLSAGTVNSTTTLNAVDVSITGNLSVSGTTTTVNSTNLNVQDALIHIAKENNANVLDVGIVGAFNDGTFQHTGLVKDATDGKWKLFSGVANEPTTTVNFSSYLKDNLEIGALYAESANIGNVSDVELQYLNGVTSGVQSQLDSKVPNSAFSDHTSATTSIHGIADVSALATKTYVDTADGFLATKESPTFTGTVILPSGTSIGNVSSTEIGYLDGVTSAIQTQLGNKASSSSLSDHTSATTSVHGIANTADLATQSYVTNITDNLAPKANPTFTGTVSGITKSMVGLANVNNTSDADKPVSTATQNALDLKADLAGPTLTGTTHVNNLEIAGSLTFLGTATEINQTTLSVEDSLIYLADAQFDSDLLDIGMYGAYGDVQAGHFHTGMVRDASDGKWKLISGGAEPTSNVVDFSGVTYDTLKLGAVEFSDGTQTKQGVPSITSIILKTGSYTLTNLSERDSVIEVSSTSPTTITIPTNTVVAYPVGTSIDIFQTNTGQVTIAGDSGVTVNATPGLKLRTQWSTATLFKRDTNTWIVYGDLMA